MRVKFTSEKQLAPERDRGIKVVYAPAKRASYRFRWIAVLLLVFSPLLLLGWSMVRDRVLVVAPGNITLQPRTVIGTGEGFVRSVAADAGETTDGGALMIIESPALEAEIDALERQLAELDASPDPAVVGDVERAALDAQLELLRARQGEQRALLERYESQAASGLIAGDKLAIVRESASDAQQAVFDTEQAILDARLRDETERAVGALVSARRALLARLDKLLAVRDALSPRAPAGTLVIDVHVQPGQWITEAEPLVTLAEVTDAVAFAYLDPRHIARTEVGSRAAIRLPDGTVAAATVDVPAVLIDQMPASFADPFRSRDAVLKVALRFEHPLDARLSVEGLPVEVRWRRDFEDGASVQALLDGTRELWGGLRDRLSGYGQAVLGATDTEEAPDPGEAPASREQVSDALSPRQGVTVTAAEEALDGSGNALAHAGSGGRA